MTRQKATLSPPLARAVLGRLLHPAVLVDRNRIILAANRIFSCRFCQGADAEGRPCYEVKHGFPRPCEECGERCPLASPGEGHVHVHTTRRGHGHDEAIARPVRDEQGDIVAFLVVTRPLFGGALT